MKQIFSFLFVLITMSVYSQSSLPVTVLKSSDAGKPLIFFICGDGGWKGFSPSLANGLNSKGFPVIGLDAKQYFWSKKTPEQAAADVSAQIAQYLKTSANKHFVLMGYSFGADVVPFIQTRLKKDIQPYLTHTVLLSPSPTTDFEIHVMEMLGFNRSNGLSVTDEINKLSTLITLMMGSEEKDRLKLKEKSNIHSIVLPGSHHYGNDIDLLVSNIVSDINK